MDIRTLLGTYKGEVIDLCLYVYNKIKSQPFEQQVDTFAELCELYGTIKSTETVIVEKTISKNDLDVLVDQYGEYINKVLSSLIAKSYKEGYSSREFYERLWKSYINSEIISSEVEIAFAIYYTIIDNKIPYFTLEPGLQMDNVVFGNYLDSHKELQSKIRFILNHGFDQKTEEASLLVKELSGLETLEEQVIGMVIILSTLRDEQKRLKRLLKVVME